MAIPSAGSFVGLKARGASRRAGPPPSPATVNPSVPRSQVQDAEIPWRLSSRTNGLAESEETCLKYAKLRHMPAPHLSTQGTRITSVAACRAISPLRSYRFVVSGELWPARSDATERSTPCPATPRC
jgi:hypothetical protein